MRRYWPSVLGIIICAIGWDNKKKAMVGAIIWGLGCLWGIVSAVVGCSGRRYNVGLLHDIRYGLSDDNMCNGYLFCGLLESCVWI